MEGLRAGRPLKVIAAGLRRSDGALGVTLSAAATQQQRAQKKLGAAGRRAALAKWARLRGRYDLS